MDFGETCEAFMLISFSVSWYWSIGKMLKSGTAMGKSLFFVLLVCSGYGFGIISKVSLWMNTGHFSSLTYLYIWNLLVTSLDAMLVVRLNQRASSLR